MEAGAFKQSWRSLFMICGYRCRADKIPHMFFTCPEHDVSNIPVQLLVLCEIVALLVLGIFLSLRSLMRSVCCLPAPQAWGQTRTPGRIGVISILHVFPIGSAFSCPWLEAWSWFFFTDMVNKHYILLFRQKTTCKRKENKFLDTWPSHPFVSGRSGIIKWWVFSPPKTPWNTNTLNVQFFPPICTQAAFG